MHPIVALLRAAHVSTFTAFAKATSARSWLIGLLVVCFWLAVGAAAVRGQSALDGFDPNANGTVNVVVVQPDGKILICGNFTTLSPNGGVAVTRNNIARLNLDGTLDTAFDPNAADSVNTIAVQTDGKILIGGDFYNGLTKGRRDGDAQPPCRLRDDGTLDGAFDPNASKPVIVLLS
jgi:hypothetical protein